MHQIMPGSALPDPIQLLGQLIGIKSLFSQPPYETKIAEYLEACLKQMDFQVTRQPVHSPKYKGTESPARYNLLAEKGTGDQALLLYGHMDTLNTVDGSHREPFLATQEGDRIYGLGAYHTKAGLSALLHTAQSARPKGYVLKLAFLADEMNLQLGAYCLAHSIWMQNVQAALTPETGTLNGRLFGPRAIGLGRRGYVTMQIMLYSASGEDVRPYLGHNLLVAASQLIDILDDARKKRDARATDDELSQPGNFSIRGFHSLPDCHNITPETATITIDRHLVGRETREDACTDLRYIIASAFAMLSIEAQVRLSYAINIPDGGNPYLLPHITNLRHPFVKMVKRSIATRLDWPNVVHNYASALIDDHYHNALAETAAFAPPTVIVGPAGHHLSSCDEWVSAQSVHDLITVYREVVDQYEHLVFQQRL